jgi:hypothetical protein
MKQIYAITYDSKDDIHIAYNPGFNIIRYIPEKFIPSYNLNEQFLIEEEDIISSQKLYNSFSMTFKYFPLGTDFSKLQEEINKIKSLKDIIS